MNPLTSSFIQWLLTCIVVGIIGAILFSGDKRLRCQTRPSTSKVKNGRTLVVRAYGVRVGHWPCLEAVFVELAWGTKRFQLWHGHAISHLERETCQLG